jgi:hypothetical protein
MIARLFAIAMREELGPRQRSDEQRQSSHTVTLAFDDHDVQRPLSDVERTLIRPAAANLAAKLGPSASFHPLPMPAAIKGIERELDGIIVRVLPIHGEEKTTFRIDVAAY